MKNKILFLIMFMIGLLVTSDNLCIANNWRNINEIGISVSK